MSYLNKVKKQTEQQRRESLEERHRDRSRQDREATRLKKKKADQPYPFVKLKAKAKAKDKKNTEVIIEVLCCSNCRRPIEDKASDAAGWMGSMIARFVRPQQHRPSTCPGPVKIDDAGNAAKNKAQ